MVTLAACGGGHSAQINDNDTPVVLKYATDLKLTEHEGYTEAAVRNPWDTTRTLHRYYLVDRDAPLPEGLADGSVIRVPVTNALIYSTVHNGLVNELGALDAIGGVCDAQYNTIPAIVDGIASGRIADCGNGMSPNLEKILALRPQVIMLSPFENNDRYGKVGELGIPIVECADYMENSPLARAEWVKFYGRLFGRTAEADSMFADTERRYLALKEVTAGTTLRPRVLIDQQYGQVWHVPGGASTMGIYITDAGGINPFGDNTTSGSIPLAPEKVLADAYNADVWLLRYNQATPKTLAELAADAPVNSQFAAFKSGNVWGCNTSVSGFYEETPYHPDRLLADLISILHPELSFPAPDYRYYRKMK